MRVDAIFKHCGSGDPAVVRRSCLYKIYGGDPVKRPGFAILTANSTENDTLQPTYMSRSSRFVGDYP